MSDNSPNDNDNETETREATTTESGTDGEQNAASTVLEIEDNPTLALRAPKDVGEKATGGAESVEDPRTAVRWVGDAHGVGKFQIVSTRLANFPAGTDMVGIHNRDEIVHWAESSSPDVVSIEDVEGFEPTDYPEDPLVQEISADD